MAMLQVGVSLMYGAPGSFTVECKNSSVVVMHHGTPGS